MASPADPVRRFRGQVSGGRGSLGPSWGSLPSPGSSPQGGNGSPQKEVPLDQAPENVLHKVRCAAPGPGTTGRALCQRTRPQQLVPRGGGAQPQGPFLTSTTSPGGLLEKTLWRCSMSLTENGPSGDSLPGIRTSVLLGVMSSPPGSCWRWGPRTEVHRPLEPPEPAHQSCPSHCGSAQGRRLGLAGWPGTCDHCPIRRPERGAPACKKERGTWGSG